ncbi:MULTISPECIES: alpha-hydroxy acid oxidase [unclassified Bradyrhizobium]|uniref:alpha-hydroxy acid oxidase n=1 Tax=unclassified Bradyrhizobium TaxID=2631580 RepID=UPI0028EBAE8D|nr:MULTISPECIES: alpha-hydroxy acid oxidase [unclassified Bradyrhizobium]
MNNITCIEDLRQLHRRRVPTAFFEYADRGSYAEETLRANRDDLQRIKFRQRVLVDTSSRQLSTEILGEKASLPLILAPVGATGMQYRDGEVLACRAAQEAGIPFTLSTMSICSIEAVAENVQGPFWFQMYMMRDRGFCKSLVDRALAARCSALVLTVDCQLMGQRHADIRNGMAVPLRLNLRMIADVMSRPAWLAGVLRGKSRNFGNLVGHLPGARESMSIPGWLSAQFDTSLTWKDVEWLRSIWPGKLVLKGIQDVEDARAAVNAGVDALVVSNHGGRQLDGAPSSISVLPYIADAVASEIEIVFDGGIRSGQDLMRALARGASSCMIGRSYIYGLGAGGQRGVAKAIDIIKKELSTTMGLCGITAVGQIGSQVVARSDEGAIEQVEMRVPRSLRR